MFFSTYYITTMGLGTGWLLRISFGAKSVSRSFPQSLVPALDLFTRLVVASATFELVAVYLGEEPDGAKRKRANCDTRGEY